MKKQILGLGTALALLCGGAAAQAEYIVNTGVPERNDVGWALQNKNNSIHWLAAEFTLTQDYFITDIEGWIGNAESLENNQFTVAIYGDGGDIPATADERFSASAFVENGQNADWNGYHFAAGSGLSLGQGTYWVAFEVRAGDTLWGFMPGWTLRPENQEGGYNAGAPTPLGNEAYCSSQWNYWHGRDDLDFGVRIQGTSPVPEPATMLLFGTGLAGLAAARRRRK